MIRVGATADKEHACCLYKTTADGTHGVAILLTGFGTEAMPGTVCDDAIQKTVNFAAHYLQRTAQMFLAEPQPPTEYIKTLMRKQLVKLNDSVHHISNHLGQGVYLSGVFCYLADKQFVSIHFGRTFAFLWDGENFSDLTPEEIRNDPYIRNALGGTLAWEGVVAEGVFPAKHQLLFTSEAITEQALNGMKEELRHANQVVIPRTGYKNLRRGEYPLAVLNLTQTVDIQSGGEVHD